MNDKAIDLQVAADKSARHTAGSTHQAPPEAQVGAYAPSQAPRGPGILGTVILMARVTFREPCAARFSSSP